MLPANIGREHFFKGEHRWRCHIVLCPYSDNDVDRKRSNDVASKLANDVVSCGHKHKKKGKFELSDTN